MPPNARGGKPKALRTKAGAFIALSKRTKLPPMTRISRPAPARTEADKRRETIMGQGNDHHGTAAQHSAAARLQEWWVRMKRHYVRRALLADRLTLEDAVCVGFRRLVFFAVIFVLLVLSNNLGVPKYSALEAMDLLEYTLDLDAVRSLTTLDSLRDILPELSTRMKQFSASSNTRFVDADGLELIGGKEIFVRPRAFYALDLPLARGAFTLSAWVERLEWPQQRPGALLRKRLPTNPELSCYAWLDQAEVHFGAHDYFAGEGAEEGAAWEEVVRGPAESVGALTHEALVVEGLRLQFYRDGQPLGPPITLPRPVTDCQSPDPVEVGSEGLALYAVKFYPRALSGRQVEEMFREGQPVLELSTGYQLRTLQEDEAESVKAALESGDRMLQRTLWRVDNETRTTAQTLASRHAVRPDTSLPAPNDHLFPPDGAPPPYLPKGEAAAAGLSARDRAEWEAGGRLTEGFVRNEWETDTGLGRRYLSVVEGPVLTDGAVVGRLPLLEEEAAADADGFSLSFWFRPSVLERGFGPNLKLASPDGAASVEFRWELDWVELELRYGGERVWAWQYMTRFDARSGSTDEAFLLWAFVQDPGPSVWRHIVVQYSVASGSLALFLDGHGVFDSQDRPPEYLLARAQLSPGNRPSVPALLNNASVLLHEWKEGYEGFAGKLAQLRLYPRLLSPAELLSVSERAVWPGGAAVRQCAVVAQDHTLQDSGRLDEDDRSCEWYYKAKQTHPIVCAAPERKKMCPVTCDGAKLCHDGSLARDRPARFPQPQQRRTYAIFNRTMWLKPANRSGSVICPASSVERAALAAECERQREFVMADDNHRNFSWFLSHTYPKVNTADIRDCAVLLARLAEEQCAWDAGWMPELRREVEETGTWSLRFWAKAVEGSLGMPTNFFFAFSFFSRLSPPLMHSFLHEREPTLEPWLDARLTTVGATRLIPRRAGVWPTSGVPYARRWTLFHMQMERTEDGRHRLCATLNAMPLACSDDLDPHHYDPARFLEAFEVTTEMLVSPIELRAQADTPSQVQQYFYATANRMDTLIGPRSSELDRLRQAKDSRVRTSATYDQRALLLAPPIILQSRKDKATCQFKVSGPIVAKQQELLAAAHCEGRVCDAAALEMVTCLGGETRGRFFGLSPTRLWGLTAYADFLAAIGDAEILVRDGELVRTRNFLDAQTDTLLILAIFHAPGSGISTALQIEGTMDGNSVHMKTLFRHLSFVPEERRGLLVTYCVVLVVLAVVLIMMDIWELKHILQEVVLAKATENRKVTLTSSDEPPDPEHIQHATRELGDKKEGWGGFLDAVAEFVGRLWRSHQFQCLDIFYTLLMAVIIIYYAMYCLNAYYNSEAQVERIIHSVINGPLFQGHDDDAEQGTRFEAVQEFEDALAEADSVSTFAFVMMILLLVKIVSATNFHPRVGLLTGTLWHSLGDLWHFALLFVTVFVCFSLASHSLFGERREFSTIQRTMETQFEILLGALPDEYWMSPHMIVYVVFANLVMFFLMLNFLLAIVVEGYTKVRQDIDTNVVENEFFYDVLLSLWGQLLALVYGWPNKLEWVQILREDVAHCGRVVSFEDIWAHYVWVGQQEAEGNPQSGVIAALRTPQHRAISPIARSAPVEPPTEAEIEAKKDKEHKQKEARTELRRRLKGMFEYYRKYDDIGCKPMFLALRQNILGRFLAWRVDALFKHKRPSDKEPSGKAPSEKKGWALLRQVRRETQSASAFVDALVESRMERLASAGAGPVEDVAADAGAAEGGGVSNMSMMKKGRVPRGLREELQQASGGGGGGPGSSNPEGGRASSPGSEGGGIPAAEADAKAAVAPEAVALAVEEPRAQGRAAAGAQQPETPRGMAADQDTQLEVLRVVQEMRRQMQDMRSTVIDLQSQVATLSPSRPSSARGMPAPPREVAAASDAPRASAAAAGARSRQDPNAKQLAGYFKSSQKVSERSGGAREISSSRNGNGAETYRSDVSAGGPWV